MASCVLHVPEAFRDMLGVAARLGFGKDGASKMFGSAVEKCIWILLPVVACGQTAVFPGNVASQGQRADVSAEIAAIENKLHNEFVSVVDRGADPTGVKDSSAAFQSAVSTLKDSGLRGGKLIIPPGNYSIASTIVIRDFYGLEVAGSGWQSMLTWTGDTTGPVLRFEGNFSSHIHDFAVNVTAMHPVATGIEITDSTTKGPTSTGVNMSDLWIRGNNGYLKDGIVVDGQDANNDYHHFTNVRVSNYTDAGWWLKGGQSYSHRFDQCAANGYSTGSYGVRATTSAGGRGFVASFHWHGGGVTSHLWDFYIDGSSAYPYVIDGVDDESDGGLVYSSGGTSNQIIVANARWNRKGDSTNPEFAHVVGGNLTIVDSTIVSNGTKTREQLTIYHTGAGTVFPAVLTIRNTVFVTPNFTLGQFMKGDPPNPLSPILENAAWDDNDNGTHGWMQPQTSATGSLQVTTGSTALVGAGTSFIPAMAGGYISIQGRVYGIQSVTDANHLALAPAFKGTTNAAESYVIGYGGAAAYFPSVYVSGTATIRNLTVDGDLRFGEPDATGALPTPQGARCPAASCATPYTWIRARSADGSVVWIPAYK
jgi:hypothetical protein